MKAPCAPMSPAPGRTTVRIPAPVAAGQAVGQGRDAVRRARAADEHLVHTADPGDLPGARRVAEAQHEAGAGSARPRAQRDAHGGLCGARQDEGRNEQSDQGVRTRSLPPRQRRSPIVARLLTRSLEGKLWTAARHVGKGDARQRRRGGARCAAHATFVVPGRLAQLGERRLDKAEVTGSSPVSSIAMTTKDGRPCAQVASSSRPTLAPQQFVDHRPIVPSESCPEAFSRA